MANPKVELKLKLTTISGVILRTVLAVRPLISVTHCHSFVLTAKTGDCNDIDRLDPSDRTQPVAPMLEVSFKGVAQGYISRNMETVLTLNPHTTDILRSAITLRICEENGSGVKSEQSYQNFA